MGIVFGTGWRGLFFANLLWIGCTAALASSVILRVWPGARGAALLPLLVVAILAARADAEHIAQIETLVALPLMGILLCALRLALPAERSVGHAPAAQRAQRVCCSAAAGALTGAVACLKILLLPLAMALFLAALAPSIAQSEWRRAHLGRVAAGFAAGLLAVFAAIAAYFAAHRALGVLWWTSISYPLAAFEQGPQAPLSRLLDGTRWLGIAVAPLSPLVLLALLRGRRIATGKSAALALSALAWLTVGFVTILSQRFSWWTYHFEMLVWPFCLLAAFGVATSREPVRAAAGLPFGVRPRRLAAFCVALLLAVQAVHAVRKRFDPDWPIPAELRSAMRYAHQVVAHPRSEAAGVLCGTGYVIGDPRLLIASGLRQAIATPGMSWWGAYLPAQRQRLTSELALAAPDFVYVEADAGARLDQQTPELARWLNGTYRSLPADAMGGTWWRRDRGVDTCGKRRQFVPP